MRALLRLLSLVFLALAVIVGVLDAARSIAAERLVLAPLGTVWRETLPGLLDALEATLADTAPAFVWDPLMTGLLALPAVAVFSVVAALMALAGRPRRRRAVPFALRS